LHRLDKENPPLVVAAHVPVMCYIHPIAY